MVRHRVRTGDRFRHIIFSDTAVTMRSSILVQFDDGRLREYNNTLVSTADRAGTSVIFGNLEADGEVIRALDARVSPATKRGQTYVIMAVRDRNGLDVDELFRDYQYEGSNVVMDTFVDPGPPEHGFLSWVEVFADRAGNAAAVDFSLAAANAFRRIYGLVWYYHASSDVANRSMLAPQVLNVGPTKPTGWTTSGSTGLQWTSGGDVSLQADEEGYHFVQSFGPKDGYSTRADDGTQAIDNSASGPTIFPMAVREEDLAIVRFRAVTNGEVLDRQSAYVLMETWIDP